jgi:pimeloyl-ACP methyl ester carboxylesterase
MARLPGGVFMAVEPLRLRALRRLPMTFGWMTKRPIPDELTDEWLAPLFSSRGARRDLAKYVRGARPADQVAATDSLRGFDRPALVVWAKDDKLMPRDHGRRLAELLPQGTLAEVDDSRTLVALDQPAELARLIREFVTSGTRADSVAAPAQ